MAGKSQSKPLPPSQAKASAVAKAKAIAPDVPARIGQTPETDLRGLPDVFGRLVEDHDRHRALLAMIEATDGASEERHALFEELVRELKSHAAAEEQALWSTVLRNPETTEFARHAVAEHKEIDKMLDDLAARDMGKPKWMERFADLKEEYLHHIREEEQEQFTESAAILSDADRRHMRSVFERRKKEEKASAALTPKLKIKSIA
ncbi:hemerythrin domain-containing protein [Novosphingobium sp. KA1]|uniref:hemerythrin domain-containing protein n=1 Tax=Novosphingobium sp. (strain KA1) TaxID=164608 RepID=UPI001A8ED7D3|nr:hemerythrin domain-containing protein [Novosphingobium sp. KA1]QSR19579.1 hemerythrin HHE cation-binding protein [Novosphingobium sp. KA1]